MRQEARAADCCLPRLWITGNNVVNNVQFLAQKDAFTS